MRRCSRGRVGWGFCLPRNISTLSPPRHCLTSAQRFSRQTSSTLVLLKPITWVSALKGRKTESILLIHQPEPWSSQHYLGNPRAHPAQMPCPRQLPRATPSLQHPHTTTVTQAGQGLPTLFFPSSLLPTLLEVQLGQGEWLPLW
jgi:hypothetical protein